MSYYDYRSFIKSKIIKICPDIRAHKDGFNRANIDSITSDSGHHILAGTISTKFLTHQCNWYQDILPVNLWLIFCGGRYVKEEIDYSLGKAHCIRNELVDRDNYPVDDILIRTDVLNFGAIPMATNDNIIVVEMNMNLVLEYCTDSCV